VIRCIVCGKEYRRLGWAIRHLRRVHGRSDMTKFKLVQAIWQEEIVKGVKRYSKAYEVKK